jgi:triacylglycerol esterase/lipase EstA (alpha/beta hydrolase family)
MKGRRLRAGAVALVAAVVLPLVGGSPAQAAPAAAAATDPVIVVNGLFGFGFAYDPLVARLRADGYQVWDFELPTLGTQDIHLTAQALADFVDEVRAQTGAAKVDLVGHSEGGLVSRTFVKYHGGASEVDSLITLGTPNHGTVAANIIELFTLGTCVGITACEQMTTGSGFLADLNAGDDSIGSVQYTNIATVVDELVQPYTSSFMNAADGNITNKSLQSQCWARFPGHLGLILDGAVYSGVDDALAKRSISFDCWAL